MTGSSGFAGRSTGGLAALAALVLALGCVVVVMESPPSSRKPAASPSPAAVVVKPQPVVPSIPEQPTTEAEAQPAMRVPAVAVPAFVGLPLDWAEETLGKYGLLLGEIEYRGSEKPPGTVLAHSPSAGEVVSEGSRVRFTVARVQDETFIVPDDGAQPAKPGPGGRTRVPAVVGSARMDAVRAVKRAKLRASITLATMKGEPDRVISQEPRAGALVQRGTIVRLTVSRPLPLKEGVAVPEITGLRRQDAQELIRASGLAQGKIRSAPGRPGYVLTQVPEAGTMVEKGSKVSYVVGRRGVEKPPRERVAVPDVKGRTLAQARADLTEAGLEFGGVTTSPGEPGRIIEQTPAAGKIVMVGSKVSLVIGRPGRSEKVKVPDVVGLRHDRGEVKAEIEAAGLRLGAVKSTTGEPGVVLSQRPVAGVEVEAGARVRIVVGRKQIETVTVPKVVGMTRGRASTTIRKAGLRTGRISYADGEKAGQVIRQSPSAGAEVTKGTSVHLVVARPESKDEKKEDKKDDESAKVKVPRVVGMQHAQASAALRRAGLRAGRLTYADGKKADQVVRQNPAAGAKVAKGSSVGLVVVRRASKDKKKDDKKDDESAKVGVPNVVGLAVGKARGDIRKVGLKVGKVTRRKVKNARKNTIVSQSPAAGTEVAKGSKVDLVLAQ